MHGVVVGGGGGGGAVRVEWGVVWRKGFLLAQGLLVQRLT